MNHPAYRQCTVGNDNILIGHDGEFVMRSRYYNGEQLSPYTLVLIQKLLMKNLPIDEVADRTCDDRGAYYMRDAILFYIKLGELKV